jgi:hypothetical protein
MHVEVSRTLHAHETIVETFAFYVIYLLLDLSAETIVMYVTPETWC